MLELQWTRRFLYFRFETQYHYAMDHHDEKLQTQYLVTCYDLSFRSTWLKSLWFSPEFCLSSTTRNNYEPSLFECIVIITPLHKSVDNLYIMDIRLIIKEINFPATMQQTWKIFSPKFKDGLNYYRFSWSLKVFLLQIKMILPLVICVSKWPFNFNCEWNINFSSYFIYHIHFHFLQYNWRYCT